MTDPADHSFRIVCVEMTDTKIEGVPAKQLWIACVKEGDEVRAVEDHVPDGWKVQLSEDRLTPAQARVLDLRPGDVTEITSRLKGLRA